MVGLPILEPIFAGSNILPLSVDPASHTNERCLLPYPVNLPLKKLAYTVILNIYIAKERGKGVEALDIKYALPQE